MMTYKPVSARAAAKVSCKYALTVAVSKRARMMVDRQECTDEFKPVLQALQEFEDDKLIAHE